MAAFGGKRSKYGAKPTVQDGVRYDSRFEAQIALRIESRIRSGDCLWALRQVVVPLGLDHKTRVDFVVQNKHGVVFAIEAKGFETPTFRKTKALWAKYGPFPLIIEYQRNQHPEVIFPDAYPPDRPFYKQAAEQAIQ